MESAKTVLFRGTNDSYLEPGCVQFAEGALDSSARTSLLDDARTSSADGTDSRPRYLRGRPAVVIPASFAAAAVVAFIAQRFAPTGWGDLGALCAAWVAFYPISRLKRRIPWWWHWMQGVVILFGFLLATRWFG